jgi:uncharacterized BrkB/YihY/UPF0761 family membrane protein
MGTTATMSKRRPSWLVRTLMITFRIVFLTLLMTGLGMGLGLFTGILTTVIGSLFNHHAVDLTRSYKVFAIPSAVIFGSCTLVFQIVRAVRERLQKQNL